MREALKRSWHAMGRPISLLLAVDASWLALCLLPTVPWPIYGYAIVADGIAYQLAPMILTPYVGWRTISTGAGGLGWAALTGPAFLFVGEVAFRSVLWSFLLLIDPAKLSLEPLRAQFPHHVLGLAAACVTLAAPASLMSLVGGVAARQIRRTTVEAST